MAQGALRAGEHGVVVGQHRAGGAVIVEEVAVDARGAGHQPVARGAGDQIREVATMALGRNGEPPILDERIGIHQICDVLASSAAVSRAAPLNGVGTCGVLGERAATQQLRIVVTHQLVGHGVRC
jgi:hypothetical protein